MVTAATRVEVLGQRHRQPRRTQGLDEGDVPVEQRHGAQRLAAAQRLERLVVVGGVLEDDAERRVDGRRVEVVDLERDQGARPVDRLRDRRRLLELELAQLGDQVDQLPASRSSTSGTWETTIAFSRSASG